MRSKVLAVLILIVGCTAFIGCNTEAGTREDATPPRDSTSPADATYPSDSPGTTATDPNAADTAGDTASTSDSAMAIGTYEQWDADASGDITRAEFDSKFASLPAWSNWDANGDQSLDEGEVKNVKWFENGSWNEMDADGDGKLARTEAGEALWKQWDGNADQKIEKTEWQKVFDADA